MELLFAVLEGITYPYKAKVQCIYCKEIIGEKEGFAEPDQFTSCICPDCKATHPDCSALREYQKEKALAGA